MKLIKKVLLFFFVSIGWTASYAFADSVATSSYSNGAMLTKMLVGLGIVLGLIFGLTWITKRLGYGKLFSNAAVHVLSSTALGNREKAVLIKVGDSVMLLGVSPGRVNQLHVFSEEESKKLSPDLDAGKSSSGNFPNSSKPTLEFSHFLKGLSTGEAEK